MLYVIEYQYATYSGTERVHVDNECGDGAELAVAKMWQRLRQRGLLTLPMAYTSAKIVRTEED
jgi:hypothetical protein